MEKRVACYEYISTDFYNVDTEPQNGALNLYCQQNGISNVEHFLDQGAIGVKSSRPSLARVIAAVENNQG